MVPGQEFTCVSMVSKTSRLNSAARRVLKEMERKELTRKVNQLIFCFIS